ncbi:Daunorubicin/doxorubicin resistance ATP-binding protein DrrA [Paraconexibacter sp. AEG42_29]|uniref:Daunorubicin/doxorubicin resistance ATP-binding protein DrrA n=1 Tax=Paraconexibacter sp. AEG42_29 TaxID=2997339 RepID=A0AAU7B0V1_9ACTN
MYETTGIGVEAAGLGKSYDDFWALRDVDLHVPAGSVLGLLGHNGAGKTTAIKILTTLASPTTGTARVAGYDVKTQGREVRSRIGVASQAATVDGLLTGRANLTLVGRLYGLSKTDARTRADELLERLDLVDAADKLVQAYSGGMRRRLDLAASIVARPAVLFLDEPTTGLDPRSRGDLWALLRELVDGGTTIVLTTQYLEEADRLADDIVVLDHGRVVAHGTPTDLKARVGGERAEVTVSGVADLAPAARALDGFADAPAVTDAEALTVTVPLRGGTRLMDIVRALDAGGVDAVDVARREATLDDVFLSLTTTSKPEAIAA